VKGFMSFSIRFLAFVSIVLLLFSCVKKSPPAGILSKQDMVDIISDIYVSEEKASRLTVNRDSLEAIAQYFEYKVLEQKATSDSVFRKSFDYYMDRPADMELIYTAVVDSLQLQEQRAPNRLK
jgi:hypothetical protein